MMPMACFHLQSKSPFAEVVPKVDRTIPVRKRRTNTLEEISFQIHSPISLISRSQVSHSPTLLCFSIPYSGILSVAIPHSSTIIVSIRVGIDIIM